MDVLTVEGLRSLTGRLGGPCVSIFLDTHATAPANRQDAVVFKTLLKSAEERLAEAGMRSAEAAALLEPARALGDDGLFWRPRPGGVAVFLAPGDPMRVMRLPVAFEPQVVVNERFHIKPLIGVVDRGERFHVLALSQNQVRLFAGGRAGLDEVDLGEMPRNILDTLRNDGFEEQLQMHTSATHRPGGGRGAAMFHGSGGADTGITKRYLTEYVKRVASGVRDAIGEPGTPLVVAAVDYLGAMYREADKTHRVAEEIVTGSPETLGPSDLHARAWPVAERIFTAERDDALVRLREATGTAHAEHDPAQVALAAGRGRVDTLFIAPDAAVWGTADHESGSAETHDERLPGDEDLADLAVVGTVLHAGRVWTAPDLAGPMAALLRY